MLCAYTRPRYQVSVYRTIGHLVCRCTGLFVSELHNSLNGPFSCEMAQMLLYNIRGSNIFSFNGQYF